MAGRPELCHSGPVNTEDGFSSAKRVSARGLYVFGHGHIDNAGLVVDRGHESIRAKVFSTNRSIYLVLGVYLLYLFRLRCT